MLGLSCLSLDASIENTSGQLLDQLSIRYHEHHDHVNSMIGCQVSCSPGESI